MDTARDLTARELLDLQATLDTQTAVALDELIAIHRDASDELGDLGALAELVRALAGTDPAQVFALLTVAVMRLAAATEAD